MAMGGLQLDMTSFPVITSGGMQGLTNLSKVFLGCLINRGTYGEGLLEGVMLTACNEGVRHNRSLPKREAAWV